MPLRQPLSQVRRQQQQLIGRVASEPGRFHAAHFTTYSTPTGGVQTDCLACETVGAPSSSAPESRPPLAAPTTSPDGGHSPDPRSAPPALRSEIGSGFLPLRFPSTPPHRRSSYPGRIP